MSKGNRAPVPSGADRYVQGVGIDMSIPLQLQLESKLEVFKIIESCSLIGSNLQFDLETHRRAYSVISI